MDVAASELRWFVELHWFLEPLRRGDVDVFVDRGFRHRFAGQ